MATTTLLQRHAGEGETIAEAIRDCLDYGKDPEKTESGKYISAYECDPATVADEFLLAKASYKVTTGWEQKKVLSDPSILLSRRDYARRSKSNKLCVGRRAATLSLSRHTPTSSISTHTFTTILLPLTVPGSFAIMGSGRLNRKSL